MKWTIQPIAEPAILRITMDERASVGDVRQMCGEIVGHGDWRPGLGLMLDDGKLDVSGINTDDLRYLGQYLVDLQTRFHTGKVALLATSTLQYGLARQFLMLAEAKGQINMNVFREEADALLWLADSAIWTS